MRGTVYIFLKAPLAGRVKTRLGADIGMGRAAALFRIMTARTIAEAEKAQIKTVLAVDPANAVAATEQYWPARLTRIAQGPGDLGERMARVIEQSPPGPMVIIGADAPDLRARHLRAAFKALAGADAVFGPAEDGGYWLIGMARRRAAPELFKDVRWSTKHTLEDTERSLPEVFRRCRLEVLTDIDDAKDLENLGARAGSVAQYK